MAWTSKASDSILNSISRIMRIQFSPYSDRPLNVVAPLMLLLPPALRQRRHSLSEPALFDYFVSTLNSSAINQQSIIS